MKGKSFSLDEGSRIMGEEEEAMGARFYVEEKDEEKSVNDRGHSRQNLLY